MPPWSGSSAGRTRAPRIGASPWCPGRLPTWPWAVRSRRARPPAARASRAERSPASLDPRDRGSGIGGPGAGGAPTVEIGTLDAHLGERVRIGGLVVDLEPDGFTVDDGSATGRVVLVGEAADYLGLIEPGDAIEAGGRVGAAGDGAASVVVSAAADLVRVGAARRASGRGIGQRGPLGAGRPTRRYGGARAASRRQPVSAGCPT